MTTTYKSLTPGEAVDALIRGEKVERSIGGCPGGSSWDRITIGTYFVPEQSAQNSYRLVIEEKPETVENALERVLLLESPVDKQYWLNAWLRVFAAAKAEIREEMKR